MNRFGDYNNMFPLYDQLPVTLKRIQFRRDSIPTLQRANSIYIPAGRWPVRGWILLARSDYDELDRYSTTLQLEVDDPRKTDNIDTLKNLSVVQAQCMTRGVEADENAIYLVEITDGRGIVSNQWFQFPLTSQYNIRTPAYPQTFHPLSMNSGTTWTWATMLEDIWNRMSTFLGTWPGFPSGVNPAGTPEGFWFNGVSAWGALSDILDYLGMMVACNLASNTPYSIVKIGATDTSFTTLQTRYKTNLEDDLEWIDAGAARIPGTIKVLFRRRNSIYGTEETVYYGNDSVAKQWNMLAYREVSVSAPAEFSAATGVHYIWSDFTIRYDDSGNPLDTDLAIANQIAQERATQYYQQITPAKYMTQTYAGALPFVTGSKCDGVCYYHDYRSDRKGWRTKIVNGQTPPFDELRG